MLEEIRNLMENGDTVTKRVAAETLSVMSSLTNWDIDEIDRAWIERNLNILCEFIELDRVRVWTTVGQMRMASCPDDACVRCQDRRALKDDEVCAYCLEQFE